ncbi:MAG: hypothetical protein BWY46_01778 [Firmicutes bacterium ADurb.Bin300]|nr:MAG: hypothetical protein BWY46_01778 [Firmicutes bacterium ADurb.Bin300]
MNYLIKRGVYDLLEYLFVLYSDPNRKITLKARLDHGNLITSFTGPDLEEKSDSCPLKDKACERWLRSLEDIKIEKWRSNYCANSALRDVERWSVDYKREGKHCRHIKCVGSYPENWSSFLGLINTLSEITDSGRLDKVEFYYQNRIKGEKLMRLDAFLNSVYLDCFEKLALDRQSEKIIYTQSIPDELSTSNEYFLKGAAAEILDSCKGCFAGFTGSEQAEIPRGTPKLTAKLYYRNKPAETFSVMYNRRDLPENWSELIDMIYSCISYYLTSGELFDRKLYGTGVKEGEYIFCSVKFETQGESHYYLTNDDTIKVADRVLVMSDTENTLRIATITKIEYFSLTDAPSPPDKTKIIVRRIRPDEKPKFYCPFCSGEVDLNECLKISRSAKGINLDVDIPDWVKQELLRKKNVCMECENHPKFEP